MSTQIRYVRNAQLMEALPSLGYAFVGSLLPQDRVSAGWQSSHRLPHCTPRARWGTLCAMLLDPPTVSSSAVYRFLISVVVPRPIAFVSTVGRRGMNAAPFSYFMPIGSRPPLLGVSIGLRHGEIKDTLANIRETGDFVINVVTEALAERMVRASGDWPEAVDEFEITGLTPVASDLVRAPRVAESPVNLECRLYREVELGDSTLVVGELLRAHVDDELLVEGRVDVARLRPLGRLGGDGYAPLREVLHLARPKVERGGHTPPAA